MSRLDLIRERAAALSVRRRRPPPSDSGLPAGDLAGIRAAILVGGTSREIGKAFGVSSIRVGAVRRWLALELERRGEKIVGRQRTCRVCSASFQPDPSSLAETCGPACRAALKGAARTGRIGSPFDRSPRTCVVCGVTYPPDHRAQETCGRGCGGQLAARTRAERKAARSHSGKSGPQATPSGAKAAAKTSVRSTEPGT